MAILAAAFSARRLLESVGGIYDYTLADTHEMKWNIEWKSNEGCTLTGKNGGGGRLIREHGMFNWHNLVIHVQRVVSIAEQTNVVSIAGHHIRILQNDIFPVYQSVHPFVPLQLIVKTFSI